MIPLIGEDSIMWGSEYPHPDGIWPDSQKRIAQDLAGVSPGVRRKILCENAVFDVRPCPVLAPSR